MPSVTAHLRNHHRGVEIPPAFLLAHKLAPCRKCGGVYAAASIRSHQGRCDKKPTKKISNLPVASSRLSRGTSLTPAPGADASPALIPAAEWTFGQPRPGSSTFSWLYVPLIRCALGLDEHGGMAQVYAGDKLWAELRDSYAAEFLRCGIEAKYVPFSDDGYIDADAQTRLLFGPLAGGQSNIADTIEGKLTEFGLRIQRLVALRTHRPESKSAPLASAAPSASSSSSPPCMSPLSPFHPSSPSAQASSTATLSHGCPPCSEAAVGADCSATQHSVPRSAPSPDESDRLSIADIASHAPVWDSVPRGCEDHWIAAARPRFRALIDACATNDLRARGQAIDGILVLAAQSLRRGRGGRRRLVSALRTRLNTVASARLHSHPAVMLLPAAAPPPFVPVPSSPRDETKDKWSGQIRRACKFGRLGNLPKCVSALMRDGTAEWTQARINFIRAKHPACSSPIPARDDSAPRTLFDKDVFSKLVSEMCTGAAPGLSGWSAELAAVLTLDPACLEGMTLLAQLIANDDLDSHSRSLLMSSSLLAISKPDSAVVDDLRPLALGEFFVKAACRYVLNTISPDLPGMFEPVQLAFSPAGCERAIQRTQAVIEQNPSAHITIHVDSLNAYNSVDRAMMLDSVYSDPLLAPLHRAFAFCYSSPSALVLLDQNAIVDVISSQQGVRQGCVLAGLGYSHTLQPAFTAAVAPFPSVSAVAIMDDLTISGPPSDAIGAFEKYVEMAATRNVTVNTSKTEIQQASGAPSHITIASAARLALHIEPGIHKMLGGYVGVDDEAGVAFVSSKLSKMHPVLRAIRDPRIPCHIALNLAKIHHLSRPSYLMRSLPMRVSSGPLSAFDSSLREALLLRLQIDPSVLPPTAMLSLCQPVGNGGVGLRDLATILPAAKWSSAACAAVDVSHIVEANPLLPFVRDREAAYDALSTHGARVAPADVASFKDVHVTDEEKEAWGEFSDPRLLSLPYSPDMICSFYNGKARIRTLQRMLSLCVESAALDAFLSSADCTISDHIRIHACRAPSSYRWLFLSSGVEVLSDAAFAIAIRLRLGLPPLPFPLPLYPCLLCGFDCSDDPWHPFACPKTRRKYVTVRHDNAMRLLCSYARSCGVLARTEPKESGSLVPDGEFHFSRFTFLVDVSGVHPLAPSHLENAHRPGQAMSDRATEKVDKYQDHADTLGASFAPLVLDVYGRLESQFLSFIERIEEEALAWGSASSPSRISREAFLAELSSNWQRDNACIILQYISMIREASFRGGV